MTTYRVIFRQVFSRDPFGHTLTKSNKMTEDIDAESVDDAERILTEKYKDVQCYSFTDLNYVAPEVVHEEKKVEEKTK